VNPEHDLRGVLRVSAFRRLWTALSLSSFGDWLGLLALTALAPKLAHDGYAAANLAIAGVFILRLAPAILIGPLAGVVADRLDRRWTMVVCDLLRFALFLSIPVVGTLWWLLVATFLIEAASLMWIPAKEATLPNLVPRERLETANQLSLLTTYGSAPVAAAVFSGLALLTGVLDNVAPKLDEVYLALFFNAATFLVSALTILRLREIPRRVPAGPGRRGPGLWRTLVEGWTFVGTSRLVRGLVAGMLGAFAAGGAVIGLARTFVRDLGGGEPGYGLLFGTVFCGLAAGMFLGPRLVPAFSRRRLLGLSLTAAGLALALLALIPHMVAAVLITLVIGGFAGVAWVTGYTLLGLEVDDALRGRTFALLQTMVRLVLVLVLAVAPLLAAAFGRHHLEVTEAMVLTYNGAAITMLLFGVLAAALGVASYRQMDDRPGMPLLADLSAAYRHEPVGAPYGEPSAGGFFIALEGGEGAGKSTQARLLAQWLEDKGHRVVVTFEPGGTELGTRLRSVLLDDPAGPATPSPRAEALLFAADRAQHVDTVIRPALHRGEVVISDRYVDSSLAYQGAGRALDPAEVARVSRWATGELRPHVTVLLDLPPEEGLRRAGSPDRLEAEPLDFHERVREQFLQLARRSGARHLVVDATRPPDEVAAQVRERLTPMLPLSGQEAAALEEARRAEQERRRAEAEERVRRQRLEAEERARRQQLEAEERVRREEERRQAEQAREEADRQQRREAAQARQREKAAREAEKAAREAEQQRAAAAAETARQQATGPHPGGAAPVSPRPRPSGPPPRPLTGEVSLLDELLGPPEDNTLQLPQVREDR
jgi:dTMP kinase